MNNNLFVFILSSCILGVASVSVSAQELTDLASPNKTEIVKQLQGDFARMRKDITPIGAIQSAWDNAKSTSGMRTIQFRFDEIIKIQLRQNMVTTIILPSWEEINQWTIGLSPDWIKVEKLSNNVLSLQPFAAGIDTNLHIIGKTGVAYAFYIRTETNNTKNITDQQIRIMHEEPEESISKRDEEKLKILDKSKADFVDSAPKTWLSESKFDVGKVRHDLTMYGDKKIAPFAIFRDDRFTYIDWGPDHEERDYPMVYQVIDDVNSPVSVRKTKDGRFMIVESVNDLALLYGTKVVCIKRIKELN